MTFRRADVILLSLKLLSVFDRRYFIYFLSVTCSYEAMSYNLLENLQFCSMQSGELHLHPLVDFIATKFIFSMVVESFNSLFNNSNACQFASFLLLIDWTQVYVAPLQSLNSPVLWSVLYSPPPSPNYPNRRCLQNNQTDDNITTQNNGSNYFYLTNNSN